MVYRCSFSNGHQTSSHTPRLSLVGLFCCCKWKHNIHRILFIGYCFCNNYTFLHIHICIRTLSGAVLPQELVDSNIEQERSDLNLCQMSNQMQQVLGGMNNFHQLSSKSWLCSVHAECVSPANQKLVEGFLLRLHDLSRGTSKPFTVVWISDRYSIQNKTFQLRACIRGQVVVIC